MGAKDGSRQVIVRGVVSVVDSEQGRPGLGTNRQSQGWRVGQARFPREGEGCTKKVV